MGRIRNYLMEVKLAGAMDWLWLLPITIFHSLTQTVVILRDQKHHHNYLLATCTHEIRKFKLTLFTHLRLGLPYGLFPTVYILLL